MVKIKVEDVAPSKPQLKMKASQPKKHHAPSPREVRKELKLAQPKNSMAWTANSNISEADSNLIGEKHSSLLLTPHANTGTRNKMDTQLTSI